MIRAIVILWTLVCGYWLFSGAGSLDTTMMESSDAYAAGAGLGMIGVVIVWGIVVIPVSVIGLLFKK